jgi:hypothetical protein
VGDCNGNSQNSGLTLLVHSWERQDQHINTFLLSQLPSTYEALYSGGGYDNDNAEDRSGNLVKDSSIKQQLLRKLATEVLLHQSLHGEVAVVQSDLQWYATGLSHSTIFAIMRFVGFSEDWIGFVKKFLEAPLNMSLAPGDGSSSGQPRTRREVCQWLMHLRSLLGNSCCLSWILLSTKTLGCFYIDSMMIFGCAATQHNVPLLGKQWSNLQRSLVLNSTSTRPDQYI